MTEILFLSLLFSTQFYLPVVLDEDRKNVGEGGFLFV